MNWAFIYIGMDLWIFILYSGLWSDAAFLVLLLEVLQPWPSGALPVGSGVPLS